VKAHLSAWLEMQLAQEEIQEIARNGFTIHAWWLIVQISKHAFSASLISSVDIA